MHLSGTFAFITKIVGENCDIGAPQLRTGVLHTNAADR